MASLADLHAGVRRTTHLAPMSAGLHHDDPDVLASMTLQSLRDAPNPHLAPRIRSARRRAELERELLRLARAIEIEERRERLARRESSR